MSSFGEWPAALPLCFLQPGLLNRLKIENLPIGRFPLDPLLAFGLTGGMRGELFKWNGNKVILRKRGFFALYNHPQGSNHRLA